MGDVFQRFENLLLKPPEEMEAPPPIPTKAELAAIEQQSAPKAPPKKRGRPKGSKSKSKTPTSSQADPQELDLYKEELARQQYGGEEELYPPSQEQYESIEYPEEHYQEPSRKPKNSTIVLASELKREYISDIQRWQQSDDMELLDRFTEKELLAMPDSDVVALYKDWLGQHSKEKLVDAVKSLIINQGLGVVEAINKDLNTSYKKGEPMTGLTKRFAQINLHSPTSLTKAAQEDTDFNKNLRIVLHYYLPETSLPPEVLLGLSAIGLVGGVYAKNKAYDNDEEAAEAVIEQPVNYNIK